MNLEFLKNVRRIIFYHIRAGFTGVLLGFRLCVKVKIYKAGFQESPIEIAEIQDEHYRYILSVNPEPEQREKYFLKGVFQLVASS